MSVTTNAEWAQLWFVDEEQTIRKLSLNLLDYQLDDTVLVIPNSHKSIPAVVSLIKKIMTELPSK